MRKGIRIAALVILFLGGTALLFWYFLMKREVPKHARCIPKDVIAVMTLNMRELALDRSSGGHLFPEMADKKIIHKELEPFARAVEANDGIGLNETADVLAFFYHNGDAAFFGVVASVKDSFKFGKLIREQLPKEFSIAPFSLRGVTMVRFDTTAAVLGWNKDIALFLYPFSNHGASVTAEQCAQLLTQSEDQSILTNADFRAHELTSFDAGIWIQTQPFLAFTEGGKIFKSAFDDVKTISLGLDFQDGELDIQRVIEGDGKNHNTPYNAPVLLSCDPKQVKGFFRTPVDFSNDSLLHVLENTYPFNVLPFDDEQLSRLSSALDGNCTTLIHDTMSYSRSYITYEYDENFDRFPKTESITETTTGISTCFGLKNEKLARESVGAYFKTDTNATILNENSWSYDNGAEKYRLQISENILTYTNWPESDGKKREIPDQLQGLDVYYPLGDYFAPSNKSGLSFLFPHYEDAQKLLSENLKLVTVSQPLIADHKRSSEIRLVLANKDVNALIQLEELFRKVYDEGK
jgi:hypothetical protein